MSLKQQYDVVILGGGLAGLSLSIQLKKELPSLSICVLERRKGEATAAAHKVGESTVELGTYYIREVLDLKDYLDANQLPKIGLRFYFTPNQKDDLTKRTELGPTDSLHVPSHQLDRGLFENELAKRSRELGNDVLLGARVDKVTIDDQGHKTKLTLNSEKVEVESKWVVDATGRRELIKRSVGFTKPMDHPNSAVWFRVDEIIDVQEWSDNPDWQSKVKDGLRRLGTIHFMDTGYWLWLIPLPSNITSVGIVFDHNIHNLDDLNTLDKAFEWIKKNEPQVFNKLLPLKDKVLDFIPLRQYPHHSGQFYNADRWAVVGEAGAFLDPFYSPGTDFISLSNSWAKELIVKDFQGEDIFVRSKVYEETHKAIIDNWLPIYKGQYQLMGDTQIMINKIIWDFATYWGLQVNIFVNNGFTDMDFLSKSAKPDGVFTKLGMLNAKVQKMFIDFLKFDKPEIGGEYVDPLDLNLLKRLNKEMVTKYESSEELIKKIEQNLADLEQVAACYFIKFYHFAYGEHLESVNPYTMDLEEKSFEEGISPSKDLAEDVEKIWFL